MPPKAKKAAATRWGQEHREAILYGFRNLGWDPAETSGPVIKTLLKSEHILPEHKALIDPHFATNDGGTKGNNNTLFKHYKDAGCEFIVERTRNGWRRKGAFFLLVLLSFPLFSHTFSLFS